MLLGIAKKNFGWLYSFPEKKTKTKTPPEKLHMSFF